MTRALTEITRDLLSTHIDFDIFNSDELREKIDELRDERKTKEDGIYFFYKDFDQEIELFNQQMAKAKTYVKWLKSEQERLKAYVVGQFQVTGELPSHSALNPIKVRESAGAVDVIDESKIPQEYWIKVQTTKLDKKRILEDLKQGIEVKGTRLARKDFITGLK